MFGGGMNENRLTNPWIDGSITQQTIEDSA